MKRFTGKNLNWQWGVIYLILLGVMAVAGARYAGSSYFTQNAITSKSLDQAALAIRLEPENPGAHEAYGITLLEKGELAGAGEAFARSVALSPNNYGLWLRLANARVLSGDPGSAEIAYLRAIELAPNYSLPNIELGRMYLDLEQRDKAFEYLAAAARLDQSHYAEVLKSANIAFGDDPDAIERAVAPATGKGRSIVAWYFMDRLWMTDKSRAYLLSDEPTIEEKNTVIRFLKEKRDYRLAREVWLSRLAIDGVAVDGTTPMVDGGFEMATESDPSGFGWQFDREISATSIIRDQKDVHSGNVAVKVRFAGNVELQRPLVSQVAFVDPGKSYTLTFFVLARDVISAGLPALLVTDPATNVIHGRSDPIEDSNGSWVRRSISFTASHEPAVLVSLQRPECSSQPCPIFGEVSIDDLSITAVEP